MINYLLDLLGYNSNIVNEILNFKLIVLILFFIAIIFIVIDITKSYNKCPKRKIKYKFIPRTFKEEQELPVPINDVFGTMFENPSPWVGSFTKVSDVKTFRNQNYVSQ